jgi:hypothetical protein
MRGRDLRNLDEITRLSGQQAARIKLIEEQHVVEITRLNALISDAHETANTFRNAHEETSIKGQQLTRRIDGMRGTIADLREMIANLLTDDAVGKDCTRCRGRRMIGGEQSVAEDYAGRVPSEDVCPEADCFGGRCAR